MGADRRGPLAAFILIAVIAAILLVTSVRSQADDGWFGPGLPATVAAGPAAGALDQAVQDGVSLVHRAAAEPAGVAGPTLTASVPASPRRSVPAPGHASTQVRTTHRQPARRERAPRATRRTAPVTPAPGRPTSPPTTRPTAQPATRPGRHLGWAAGPSAAQPGHDHGRHLGWTKHQT